MAALAPHPHAPRPGDPASTQRHGSRPQLDPGGQRVPGEVVLGNAVGLGQAARARPKARTPNLPASTEVDPGTPRATSAVAMAALRRDVVPLPA